MSGAVLCAIPGEFRKAAIVLLVLDVIIMAVLVIVAAQSGRCRRVVVWLAAKWPALEHRLLSRYDSFLRGLEGVRAREHILPVIVWSAVLWFFPAAAAWTMIKAVGCGGVDRAAEGAPESDGGGAGAEAGGGGAGVVSRRVDLREQPNYCVPEAAHYLRIPESALCTWLLRELISIPGVGPSRLSFVNMVEAHVLSAIRYHHGVDLPAVRRAVDYLKDEFGSRHPLAEEQFETDGVNLFVQRFGKLLNVSSPGQFAMREILEALLKRIDRDERGLAIRLYPFSRRPVLRDHGDLPALKDSPRVVVIDPRVGFGRPVLAGTGITTLTIAERFDGGESIEELAADYGRSPEQLQEAIRCELTRDAA